MGEASPAVDRLLVPLPHPSGQSRWLNDPARRLRLEAALVWLGGLLDWSGNVDPGAVTPCGDAKIPRLPNSVD